MEAETLDSKKEFVEFVLNNDKDLKKIRRNLTTFLTTEKQLLGKQKERLSLLDDNNKIDHTCLIAVQNLPFSGSLKISLKRNSITVNPRNFFPLTESVSKIADKEADLKNQIKLRRTDNEDAMKNEEFELIDLLVLILASRFAIFTSRNMISGLFASPKAPTRGSESKIVRTSLSKNSIQLMLAIETLNSKTILEYLQNSVKLYSQKLEQLSKFDEAIFDDKNKERYVESKKKFKELFKKISATLVGIERSSSDEIGAQILSECITELENCFKSAFGSILCSPILESRDVVGSMNLTAIKEYVSPNQNNTLSAAYQLLISEYFVNYKDNNMNELGLDDVSPNSSNENIEPFASVHSIVHRVSSSLIDEYNEIFPKVDHLFNTLSAENMNAENHTRLKRMNTELNNIIKWHSDPKENKTMIQVIKNPPEIFRGLIEEFNDDSVVERFENQLNHWYRMITYDPEDGKSKKNFSSLIQDVASKEKDIVTILHKRIQSQISGLEKAHREYMRQIHDLENIKNTVEGYATKQREDSLKEKRKILLTLSKSLRNQMTPERYNRSELLAVCDKISGAVQNFSIALDETQHLVSSQSVGEPKTMMIGLGQAGQQIVKSAIARYLNDSSDTRCANILAGLNIDPTSPIWENINIDNPLEANEEKKRVFEHFDSANLLAINAGDELRRMLKAPYNYIWGSTGQIAKREVIQQENDHMLRPATNLVLLDKHGQGAGNKMGKGRAYAVRAENGIKEVLKFKVRGQNIAHVCVVHSFAGGSGSGMILPFLAMLKQQLPTSIIWVISAGAEYQAPDPYKSQNTTYITSDILQSHYHATHHRPVVITADDWDDFKRYEINGQLKNLEKIWEKIEGHITENKHLREDNREKGLWKDLGIEPQNPQAEDSRVDILEGCVPNPNGAADFANFAKNIENKSKVQRFWKQWMLVAQDSGSLTLENHPDLRSAFTNSRETEGNMTTSYKITYANIMAICNGIQLSIECDGDSEEAKMQIKSKKLDKNIAAFWNFGASIVAQDIDAMEDLKRDLTTFASAMRSYHSSVESLGERIRMMIGATEDTRIKHIVISNAHLDPAANAIYDGQEANYDLYNSVMVDVFTNLIHGLVESIDYSNHQGLKSSASSLEFMDTNDLRTVTSPPIHASIIDLSNTFDSRNSHGYEQQIHKRVENDPVMEIFRNLFIMPESPLFDSSAKQVGELKGPVIEYTRSLYHNCFSEKDGLRKYSPFDAIPQINRTESSDTWFQMESLSEFWNKLDTKLKDRTSNEEYDFGKQELLNVLNWLSLMPYNLLIKIYGSEPGDFTEYSKSFVGMQENRVEGASIDSPFHPRTRKNRLGNMVGNKLSCSALDKNRMAEFLERFGILNEHHLAILPSSYFYEFGTLVMLEIEEHLEQRVTVKLKGKKRSATIRMIMKNNIFNPNPPPSFSLARNDPDAPNLGKELTTESDFEPRVFGYLRVPIIQTNEDVGARNSVIELNSKFMKHFSMLKIKVGQDNSMYSNISIIDLLMKNSSDNELSPQRDKSEVPKLRSALEDLEIFSSSRKVTDNEPLCSRIIRVLLLGNAISLQQEAANPVLQDLITKLITDVEFSDVGVVKFMNTVSDYDYGETFQSDEFEKKLELRLHEISGYGDKLLVGLVPQTSLIIRNFVEQVTNYSDQLKSETVQNQPEQSEPEMVQNRLKASAIFEKLRKNYKDMVFNSDQIESLVDYVEESDEVGPEIAISEISSHFGHLIQLFSRIHHIIYNAKRQYLFEIGGIEAGRGVAYELEGTLDSIRSKPDRFLALVNTTSDISPSEIKYELNSYYNRFLDGNTTDHTNPNGKIFVQKVQSGPVAHMTLLQERAAIVEIAQEFSGLIADLKINGWKVITDTLVHPYSFLKNMLWLSVMLPKWTSRANSGYTNSFSIPDDVIERIFSKPKTVNQLRLDVLQDPLMDGFEYSELDTNQWDSLVELNNQESEKRAKIHVPDLLLIKSMQFQIDKKQSLRDVIHEASDGKKPYGNYKPDYWEKRLGNLKILDLEFDPLEGDTQLKDDVDDEIGEWLDDENTSGKEDDDNVGSNENPWLSALNSWVEFIEEDAKNKTQNQDLPDEISG